MKCVTAAIFVAFATLSTTGAALSQQANQPKYKPGEWWKVKTEFEAKISSRNEGCQDSYKEWLAKIDDQGLAHLYGINGVKEVESSCDTVMGWVFGINESKRLNFPLSVGQTWTHRYAHGSARRPTWIEPQYKVAAWEKVQTPKGTFEAFKIVGKAEWVTGRGDQAFNNWTEYYAPSVKAIVFSESETAATKRKVTLVDFNVSN